MRCVIDLGPIMGVADIMQRHAVAVHDSPRLLVDIGLPAAAIAWFQREPPGEHKPAAEKRRPELPPHATHEDDRSQNCDPECPCRENVDRREIVIDSRDSPNCATQCDEPSDSPPQSARHANDQT